MYIISSGKNYLARSSTGAVYITPNKKMATRYPEASHASNALAKMPRSVFAISSKWAVVNEAEDPKNPTAVSPPAEASPNENNVSFPGDDLPDLFDKLADFDSGKESCRKQLLDDLSVADQEISDIYHFIELNQLNVCEGYKAYKMLRDTLLSRRQIKNKLYILDQLSMVCKDSNVAKQNEVYHNRVYRPRQLTGLFKNT